MGHHAEDAERVSVLGCSHWLTFCMRRFDSEQCFFLPDRLCGGTEDMVILPLIPVETHEVPRLVASVLLTPCSLDAFLV